MLINQIPPHNIDIEMSILSTMMIDPRYNADLVDMIQPNHFYRTAHQLVFRACRWLIKKNEPVDAALIVDVLKKQEALENAGGAAFISRLLETPIATNPIDYANIVIRDSAMRELIAAAQTIQNSAFNSQDATKTLDEAQQKITKINISGEDNTFHDITDLAVQSVDRYEALNNRKRSTGIRTGFSDLDFCTGGGLSGSKLITIGARPRVGKTAIACNMIRYMARHGAPVGMFSIEMDKEEIMDRIFSMESGLNSMRFTGKGPEKEDWQAIHETAGNINKWKVLIDDSGGLSVGELCRRARIMKRMGVGIIFIDQFSKIKAVSQKKSRFEQKSEIVEYLGDLKKELRIPIILLAQILRGVEKQTNKKPCLADLKDTGQLEEESDIVLLLHREGLYKKNISNPIIDNSANLEIAKHRQGPCRDIKLFWDDKRTLFCDMNNEKQWNGG